MSVFTAFKGTVTFIFLYAINAAGVVPCDGRKKFPHTSAIVQIIFYSWSFKISGNGPKINFKLMLCLEPYSRQRTAF